MKNYIYPKTGVFCCLADDGSQDHLITKDMKAITQEELDKILADRVQEHFDSKDYVYKRAYSYPSVSEFLDAWVKDDQAALDQYRQKCLAVKAKYPKP